MEKTAPPNFDKEIIQAIKDIPPALNKLTGTLQEVPKQTELAKVVWWDGALHGCSCTLIVTVILVTLINTRRHQ
jgi:hypothetical protein